MTDTIQITHTELHTVYFPSGEDWDNEGRMFYSLVCSVFEFFHKKHAPHL